MAEHERPVIRDTFAAKGEPPPFADPRELATVLAALRYYQSAMSMNGGMPPFRVAQIATDDDTLVPLGIAEIDALCERINR